MGKAYLRRMDVKYLLAASYLALAGAANAADLSDVSLEGDMRKLVVHDTAEAVPGVTFDTPDGETVALADYAGTPVVLNFWATWCAPCREEMPALQEVQTTRDGAVEVVTVATGKNSVDGIMTFFEEEGITELPILLDLKQGAARQMAVLGLPVTVLIDAEGREVARLTGGADWAGPEAQAVIDALVAPGT
ncbi:Thiol:disulfide interchange protein TlpA [Palleronia abyssalis]|uniref:Thiol:disulfide interchange protein TlpA n=2 Tax=Palleronia abyssalis TaxID=1501240 RepID=A0A2R8BX19_9RHOB|nr:Thiol:disulfide interchange protein TlpA [Palleronia abyssalis]